MRLQSGLSVHSPPGLPQVLTESCMLGVPCFRTRTVEPSRAFRALKRQETVTRDKFTYKLPEEHRTDPTPRGQTAEPRGLGGKAEGFHPEAVHQAAVEAGTWALEKAQDACDNISDIGTVSGCSSAGNQQVTLKQPHTIGLQVPFTSYGTAEANPL